MSILRSTGLLISSALLLTTSVATGVSAPAFDGIRIRIVQPGRSVPNTRPGVRYLNGFCRKVSGQTIPYHSSHPDAKDALIARTQEGMQSIAWETDTVRGPSTEGSFRFVWLSGIDRAGFGIDRPARTFQLLVNGHIWFSFKSLKDTTALRWLLRHPNGAALEFQSDLLDQYGDLFGRMYLTVPESLCTPGKPFVLGVHAEDAGRPDWYMTLMYSFNFVPALRCEPVILKRPDGNAQLLQVRVDNLVGGRMIVVDAPGQSPVEAPLAVGPNALRVPVFPVAAETALAVQVEVEGEPTMHLTVLMKPVNRREVFLLPYSHNDIGYTDLQPNVEKKQWKNLEEALTCIERTRAYPHGAQYKWNLEILWPLDGWLRQASAANRERFWRAVKEGRIGLNAFYGNILTGLATDVEMSHCFDFAHELGSEHGFPVETAVISDIPGFTWGTVTALAQSGIRYFAVAPNAYDRIGHAYELWGDRPFYWVSQSGRDSVLTWMAGSSYSAFHEGELSKLGDEKMLTLLRQFDRRECPYEIVQLPYTVHGDNGPPDPALPDFVRSWNERYETPRLAIATHAEMFRAFEKRYGEHVKHVRGDFTPYWEDGAASTARETALNREAAGRLAQGEVVWSMLAPAAFPRQKYRDAWTNVILYDEHTWGAWNSISEPDSPIVRDQWEIKKTFAMNADSLSRRLLTDILDRGRRGGRNETAIDVFNTSSWTRTDVVFIPADESRGGDVVVDGAGRSVRSQRLTTGELAFLAAGVHPFSAARFFVRAGKARPGGAARASRTGLDNGRITLRFDARTGAVESFRWGRKRLELAGESLYGGIGSYVYVPGRDPKDAQGIADVRLEVKERGGLVASVLIRGDAPGCTSYESEIRVYDGVDRVDIAYHLNRKKVREKEGVHFAFPFSIPGSDVRYDVASSIVMAERDQIGGACKNFLTAQNWVDVSNDSIGVTCALVDAPMFEIGGITAEQPWLKTIEPSSLILSYAMNNYWHTNYKADQEGPVTFRYSLVPHGRFDGACSVRAGMERRQPLLVRARTVTAPLPSDGFRFSDRNIIVSSIRPIDESGTLLALLYNPTDIAREGTLSIRRMSRCFLSNAGGHAIMAVGGPLTIAANGVQYLRLEPSGRN